MHIRAHFLLGHKPWKLCWATSGEQTEAVCCIGIHHNNFFSKFTAYSTFDTKFTVTVCDWEPQGNGQFPKTPTGVPGLFGFQVMTIRFAVRFYQAVVVVKWWSEGSNTVLMYQNYNRFIHHAIIIRLRMMTQNFNFHWFQVCGPI